MQEVEEVLPELVKGRETEETRRFLSYHGFTPLLVEAVKEQQVRACSSSRA